MIARRARNSHGAAAVEFALVVIPVFAILFGLIQYGMYFYSSQTGSNTANAAARQLSVGNCQNNSDLQTYVNNQLGAARSGTATAQAVYTNPDGSTPASPAAVEIGGTVKLTLTFNTINMHFPFVPFLSNAQITREVQARVEDTTDQGCGS